MTADTAGALESAIWMASFGYQIWPCRLQLNEEGAKKPKGLPPHWTEGGLTNPEKIKAQWVSVRATGYIIACGPSRITVVDTDIKNGVDGNQNYLSAGGNGASFIVQTWSGGWHRYYRSAGIGNSTGHPPGVDVRGIGGGAFGPGSIVLDRHGNFVGQYAVNVGAPHIAGLTPEPANLAHITQAPKVFANKEEGDALLIEHLRRYPPMTLSRARQAVANKVNELRTMKNVPKSGMRYKIMGTAMLLSGVMYADLGYDYDMAHQALMDACKEVYGPNRTKEEDEEDEQWIETGLADGLKKPIPVYPDPLPPEQADPLGVSGVIIGTADDRIVDLTPYLDGTYQAPQPDVGAKRSDGIQMMYGGRWHTAIGLTEAGKSLFAVWQAVSVIQNGGLVVYLHFEESDVRGTLERVRVFGQPLGIDDGMIRKQFIWMNCETRWAEGQFAQALSKLPQPPALVILDGVNAATAQHGEDVMRPEAVAKYRALFVTPATSLGATVLSLGHPPKDRTRQGERHSFGSTAWLDECDGVAFRLVASAKPIAKGRSGSSALSSVKDRYGEVKRWGLPDPKKEPGWFYLGQFVVDDSPPQDVTEWMPQYTQHGTTAFVAAPKTHTEGQKGSWMDHGDDGSEKGSEGEDDDDSVILTVVAQLAESGKPVNKRLIYAHAGMAKRRVDDALERLVYRDALSVTQGPNRSQIYSVTEDMGVPHDQI
jgi:Bifunctional DNA primase/polymerase, N-terminal